MTTKHITTARSLLVVVVMVLLSDFFSGNLTGSGTVDSSGSLLSSTIAIDGSIEGYETVKSAILK